MSKMFDFCDCGYWSCGKEKCGDCPACQGDSCICNPKGETHDLIEIGASLTSDPHYFHPSKLGGTWFNSLQA